MTDYLTLSQVIYVSTICVEKARKKMKRILLEGVFIYFFAKFSHCSFFSIKYSYYLKSEPVRYLLLLTCFSLDRFHVFSTKFDSLC
jgi:hypothetical protein